MNESMEEYFLKMLHHLKKINKFKIHPDGRQSRQNEGKIEISSVNSTVRSHILNLGETQKGDFLSNR